MSNRAARRFEQTNPSTLAPARWHLALAAALALVGLSWTLPMTAAPAAATAGKITICHRTHSTTNPYRRITVSQNAVQNSRHGGHDLPNGSSNPAVYDPAFSYAPNNKYWGDIIPGGDAAGLVYNGTTAIALNWTAAGQADFATYCAPLTPTQFYNAEIVAGETQTSVLADLNDQAANEDVALLAALGGSFTAANLATWTTAVTVTTTAATQVATSTATLTGSLTVGSTTTIAQFQYGTSPTLAGSTTVAATPTPVTNTTAVTAAVSGLSPGTTYYFMVTGTTNAGTDTEGVLNGAIMSFDTSPAAPTAQTITFVQPSAMVTGDPAQALTVSASSGLIASVISNDTSVCTVSAATVSTVAAGTCSLTASQPGDSTYSAAPAVTRTFAVTAPVSTSTTTTVAVTTTTVPQTTTTVPTTTTTATTVPTTTTTATTSPATTTTATTSPATTTTGPPSTTTPEPGIAPGADGIVRGVVWFDRNRNGLLDASEWMLPGVTVTLEDSSTGLRLQTVRAQGGSDRRTAVTAADGSYAFGGLPVGPYRVTANVTIQGFDYTSDTDGAADWRVDVSVRALTVSTADFAGLGRGEVTGQVFDSTSLQGVPEARISCRWSGYDDLLGNDDDVMFTLTADASGSFDLAGVPYGYFTCDGRDPSTARQSSPVGAAVFAPEAVNTPLPVGGLDAPLAVPIADVLPSTGDDPSHWLLLAALLLGGGVFAIAIARRPSVR